MWIKINKNGRKAINMELEIHILFLHKNNTSLMKVKITELERTAFAATYQRVYVDLSFGI